MYEREIQVASVRNVIARGEVVATYPDDKPHPSWLLLGHASGRYTPDLALWDQEFKRRAR